VAKGFDLPVIRDPNDIDMFENDLLGQNRNALINSPSKITGVSVPTKKKKNSGDEGAQMTGDESLAEADHQPRLV
jgi:hypothetical protein